MHTHTLASLFEDWRREPPTAVWKALPCEFDALSTSRRRPRPWSKVAPSNAFLPRVEAHTKRNGEKEEKKGLLCNFSTLKHLFCKTIPFKICVGGRKNSAKQVSLFSIKKKHTHFSKLCWCNLEFAVHLYGPRVQLHWLGTKWLPSLSSLCCGWFLHYGAHTLNIKYFVNRGKGLQSTSNLRFYFYGLWGLHDVKLRRPWKSTLRQTPIPTGP